MSGSFRFQPLIALVLILLGTFLSVPIAVVLGIISGVLEVVREVWARWGLRGVEYRRHLARERANWDERLPLTIEIWNRKRLPLAWIRADDVATAGVVIAGRSLRERFSDRGTFSNVWTLAPFERVAREFQMGADRRGVFELGPVDLTVGDLLGQEVAIGERPGVDTFLVRPRTVPMPELHRRDRWGGLDRARIGLSEDPARFAGVREYAPGDPLRRIHPRASARLGRPVVKRFEPSRDRELVIALDVQTDAGPSWNVAFDDEAVEALYVVAASLATSLSAERAAFGLGAAGYSGAERRLAWLPPSAAPGQAERVLDLLARLSSHPSAPFERLLGMVGRVAQPGTTVIVISARDPRPLAAHLRALERAGCHVVVLACGTGATSAAAHARAAGFAARTARFDGPWRTAQQLTVTP